jgi:alanyl-tRNA synthetase
LVKKRFGYDNVGFHLGTEDSTLDFNGEITAEELKELEWRANEVVVENLDIIETYPQKEEVEKLEFRSKKELDEGLRIIIIPGYDKCACCAPQLKKTGEIGVIKLTNIQRHKGGVRITMLCGFRALQDYQEKEKSVKSISVMLSSKEGEVIKAVNLLKEDVETWKYKHKELVQKLIKYKVKEITEFMGKEITEFDGKEISEFKGKEVFEKLKKVCIFEYELEGEGPRYLMNHVLEQESEVCAVLYPDNKEGFRYVIGSRKIDVRPIGKDINEKFNGRGGGKANMVQGTIKGEEFEVKKWFEMRGFNCIR